HDIQEFVVSFFSSGKFPQGVNSAFITLIPKVSNPLFIKYYSPISLIGLHYKIVAKILSNRLSKVIDSIISPEQSAFISGRQILDGPLILSEIIDWSPTSEFSLKRGLRQGDPLSPFLFIIVIDGLHMALNDGIASNMFHGVRIGSNIHLSHLFYADDVIILSDWNQNDMENITRILNIFYIASGLKINFHKSNVFGVGVSNSEVVSMSACTGCEADIDSISCMVYNGHVESNDHIFFTYDTAVAIWNLVRSWIDLPLPSFLSCEDLTNWFDS
nr:RNA-directed DNA polymerase, eukaryota, reverse transcriptase zinc-binding domain protein [Tanacetum cinerariifolium]